MIWTDLKKDWKTLSKNFKSKWSKLTDADLAAIAGSRDELIKRLEKHYKTDKVKLAKDVDEFVKSLKSATA